MTSSSQRARKEYARRINAALDFNGRHLCDPRRSAPEKLRTIIRHPVE